ncbi:zeta toxin family protein [Nonomuraea solani]|uniref:zeta toxin family protein n=1 Tax=Nonomuraea solani TaxID=1144553 RepID=UPI0011AFFB2F|nr:zeta toxin family protein [Nonomuraea solani]
MPDCVKPYIGWVVGMDWPEGDETGCFRLADACVTAAYRLVEGTPADQPWNAAKIGADWEGDAHLAFAEHVTTAVGGKVADLVNRLVNTAVALNNVGVQIQYAKYMIEVTVWLLAGQILYLTAAALASSGASLALIPPRVRLARLTVAQIARQTLRNIALFAAIVAAMDGGVQLLQLVQGRRDEIDLRQLGVSALTGGAMGGLMGVLSGGLTRLATPALRAGLTRAEMSVAEKLLAAASSSLYGQAAQYAVTGGMATAGALLAEGNFSWEMLAKGITSSALGADGQHLTTSLPHGGSANGPSPAGSPPPDGGSSTNGGPSPEGGSSTNGGSSPDGAPSPDGSPSVDGGPSPDGGPPPDGGLSPDRGSSLDGGASRAADGDGTRVSSNESRDTTLSQAPGHVADPAHQTAHQAPPPQASPEHPAQPSTHSPATAPAHPSPNQGAAARGGPIAEALAQSRSTPQDPGATPTLRHPDRPDPTPTRQEPGQPPISRIERLLNHDTTQARPDTGPTHAPANTPANTPAHAPERPAEGARPDTTVTAAEPVRATPPERPGGTADPASPAGSPSGPGRTAETGGVQDHPASLDTRPPAFHRTPTDEELRTIFEDVIIPEMLTGATRSPEPTMIVVGGQPGAGKSTTIARLHEGFRDRGGILQIIMDEYKRFYPDYDQLRAWNDIETNNIVQPIAKKWQSMAFDYAIANGYNVIVEATLGNPKDAAAFIRLFQEHGYRIETELVATARAQSRLSLLTRYLSEKISEGAGRLVPGGDHDVRFFGSAEVIGSLESADPPATVDAVRIRLRDGEAVFVNERGPDGEWTGTTGAQEALRAERERPWTAAERAEFTRRLNNLRALLEHQRQQHPEDAATYDRLSREADEVAAMAEPWLSHDGAGDYLRDILGMTPDATDWSPQRSREFERRIGDFLSNDPEARVAADRMIGRLREVLISLHEELYQAPEARTERTFFKDDPTSPGQVGRDTISLADLRRDGNLRMLMTAIYNAAFFSKDDLAVQGTLFELRTHPDWPAIADRAGLDVSRLAPALEGDLTISRDIFEVPNLGTHSRETDRAVAEFEESQAARWTRTVEDREAFRVTPQDFVNRDIPMHALEIDAHQRHLRSQYEDPVPEPPAAEPPRTEDVSNRFDDPADGEDWSRLTDSHNDAPDPHAPLEWLLGTGRYGMHTDHPWVREVSGESNLPLVAGISGTAARLHSLFLWIRPEGVTEEHFTRALLGWMLSMEDHSVYEIVRGIEVASPHLFGDPNMPYRDAIDLYRRIVPLETLADIAAGMNPAREDSER